MALQTFWLCKWDCKLIATCNTTYFCASLASDGAGWHQSHELAPPANLRLLKLPPYSPELNPAEHLWDELREKSFHNPVFDSIDALEVHLESALREMENGLARVRSIVAWPWIIRSLVNY